MLSHSADRSHRAPVHIGFDFHQSPVGAKHEKKHSAVAPSPNKRRTTLTQKITHALASAKRHFLNATASEGKRALPIYRQGLKDTSRAVGDLLGKLIYEPGLGDQALQKAFARIENAAAPVTPYETFDAVLAARLRVHLRHLTAHELKTLVARLANRQDPLGDNSTKAHLDNLQVQLTQEITRRAINDCQKAVLPGLQQAMATAEEDARLGPQAFEGLRAPVRSVMERYGLDLAVQPNKAELLARRLLCATIDQLLQRQHIHSVDLVCLLEALPSAEQRLLKFTKNQHLSTTQTRALDQVVDRIVEPKKDKISLAFLDAVDDVTSALDAAKNGAPLGTQGLRAITEAASQLKALRTHREAYAMGDDPLIERENAKLIARLATLRIAPEDLEPLEDRELRALTKALEFFDVPVAGTQALTDTIQARLDKVFTGYNDSLLSALDTLEKGDVSTALTRLALALDKKKKVVEAQVRLGGRESIKSGTYETSLSYYVVKQAGDDRQSWLATQDRQSHWRELIPALHGMGSALAQTPPDRLDSEDRRALGTQLQAMAAELNELLRDALLMTMLTETSEFHEPSKLSPHLQTDSVKRSVREAFPLAQ